MHASRPNNHRDRYILLIAGDSMTNYIELTVSDWPTSRMRVILSAVCRTSACVYVRTCARRCVNWTSASLMSSVRYTFVEKENSKTPAFTTVVQKLPRSILRSRYSIRDMSDETNDRSMGHQSPTPIDSTRLGPCRRESFVISPPIYTIVPLWMRYWG